MERADVVIIGGSAAGATAAISCKRRNPGKSMIVIRQEEQVSIPCGIPYIFGTLGSPQKNLIPDAVITGTGAKLFIGVAETIDRKKKVVKTNKGEEIQYDKLILATGASPTTLPVPGIEKENVFPVRKEVGHLQKILDAVNKANDIVIIGGGFIGAEFADECKKNHQVNVTIIEKLPHCLQLAFDEEYCVESEKILTGKGIKIITNDSVAAILGDTKVNSIRLASGTEIKADVVIVSIGLSPNGKLAVDAGLRLDKATGGIMVDKYQRTEDSDIFAIGDCASKVSFFSGKPVGTRLASVATNEARIAGANLFGNQYPGVGVVGVYSTQVGELAIAVAGLIERQARQEGYDVAIGQARATSRHPGGMPGSVLTGVKLIFSKKDGVLIGGEASGGNSVGELINAVSACIQQKMTAQQVSMFQMGTHPALCASPMAYQIVNAAEEALTKLN
jgi:NADH oxidase (H2O2-forming)